MNQTRICHVCGTRTASWCPKCQEVFAKRRSADEMTGDERAAEMRLLGGPLEIPFELVHQRIEELVGRSVWTHEMGTQGFAGLIDEARTRDHPGLHTIIKQIPEDKRIIVCRGES